MGVSILEHGGKWTADGQWQARCAVWSLETNRCWVLCGHSFCSSRNRFEMIRSVRALYVIFNQDRFHDTLHLRWGAWCRDRRRTQEAYESEEVYNWVSDDSFPSRSAPHKVRWVPWTVVREVVKTRKVVCVKRADGFLSLAVCIFGVQSKPEVVSVDLDVVPGVLLDEVYIAPQTTDYRVFYQSV